MQRILLVYIKIMMLEVLNFFHQALAVVFTNVQYLYFRRKLLASSIECYYFAVARPVHANVMLCFNFGSYKFPLSENTKVLCLYWVVLDKVHRSQQEWKLPSSTLQQRFFWSGAWWWHWLLSTLQLQPERSAGYGLTTAPLMSTTPRLLKLQHSTKISTVNFAKR